MRRSQVLIWVLGIGLVFVMVLIGGQMVRRNQHQDQSESIKATGMISLPPPAQVSNVSVEQALWGRRSVRSYRDKPLSLDQAGQLLWAAQGVSDASGHRTAPSAGALYPLEVYLVAGKVEDLETGVYQYLPDSHALERVNSEDSRAAVADAALKQDWIADAPAIIVIAAVYSRTSVKYGERTVRYVHMEVGAAAENVYLQAESLGLGTVFVGAFYEMKVQSALDLPEDVIPLCLMPVGGVK